MAPPAGYYYDENGQLQMTPETRAAQEAQARQIMAKNGGQDVTFQAPQPQMPAAPVKSPSVPPEIMKSLAFSSTITPEQVAKAKAASDLASQEYRQSEAGVSPMSRMVSALGAALPMIFSKGVGGKYAIQGYENAQDVLVKNAAMEQKRRSEIMDTENKNYDQLLRQQQLEATNRANWENKAREGELNRAIQRERNQIMASNGYVLGPDGTPVRIAQQKFDQGQQDRGEEEVPLENIIDNPEYPKIVQDQARVVQSKGGKTMRVKTASDLTTVQNKALEGQSKQNKLNDYAAQQITDQDRQTALASYESLDEPSRQMIANATDRKSLTKAISDISKAQSKNDFLQAKNAKSVDEQKLSFDKGMKKATEEPKAVLRFAEQVNDTLSGKITSLDEVAALFTRTAAVQGKGSRISDKDYALNDPSGIYADILRGINGVLGTASPVLTEDQKNAIKSSVIKMAATAYKQLNDAYGSEIAKNLSNDPNVRQYRLLSPDYFSNYYTKDIEGSNRIARKFRLF